MPYNTKFGLSFPKTGNNKTNECDSEKAGEISPSNNENSTAAAAAALQSTTVVHSIPLNSINRSVAVPVSINKQMDDDEKPAIKPKALHNSVNLIIPPRKPISSVAPNSSKSGINQSIKVNMVAPTPIIDFDKLRPALPPKPNKIISDNEINSNSVPTVVSVLSKPPISEPVNSQTQESTSTSTTTTTVVLDNLPIKAKPLTIRKQPLSEQPRLKSLTSGIKPIQYTSRRIEMPPAFLFPEIERVELKDKSSSQSSNNSSVDETDKSSCSSISVDEKQTNDEVIRRIRKTSLNDHSKIKLSRRVSFDPLALLLDASLEGELELVKKTAMQVTNPSAANDEGITALHNAICAGHIEIVK